MRNDLTQVNLGSEDTVDVFSQVINSDATDEAKTAAFVGHLMSRNYREYADMTQGLMDGYREDIKRLERELAAVKRRITAVCSQPWTPSVDIILQCLDGEPDIPEYMLLPRYA